MACFTVPAAEAIITTVVAKAAEKKEISAEARENDAVKAENASVGHSFIRKLKWLNCMLWGGAALLLFEHIWHGEITAWFPFLTNAANPADRASMLYEMGTSGVAMALLITAVWTGIVLVTHFIEKRTPEAETESR